MNKHAPNAIPSRGVEVKARVAGILGGFALVVALALVAACGSGSKHANTVACSTVATQLATAKQQLTTAQQKRDKTDATSPAYEQAKMDVSTAQDTVNNLTGQQRTCTPSPTSSASPSPSSSGSQDIVLASLNDPGPGQCWPGRDILDKARADKPNGKKYVSPYSPDELTYLSNTEIDWVHKNLNTACVKSLAAELKVASSDTPDFDQYMSKHLVLKEVGPDGAVVENTFFDKNGQIQFYRIERLQPGELVWYDRATGNVLEMKFACGNRLRPPPSAEIPPSSSPTCQNGSQNNNCTTKTPGCTICTSTPSPKPSPTCGCKTRASQAPLPPPATTPPAAPTPPPADRPTGPPPAQGSTPTPGPTGTYTSPIPQPSIPF